MKSNNVEPTTALIGCAKMQQWFLVLAMYVKHNIALAG